MHHQGNTENKRKEIIRLIDTVKVGPLSKSEMLLLLLWFARPTTESITNSDVKMPKRPLVQALHILNLEEIGYKEPSQSVHKCKLTGGCHFGCHLGYCSSVVIVHWWLLFI